jgi:MFS family permease
MTLASFLNQFPESAVPSYPGNLQVANNLGLTVGIWNLGCLVSAVVAIFIGDRLGRKKIVFTGLLLLLVGEIIQCTAFHWGQFVAGRFIAGLGNGLNCATVPAWQAECTKAHRRGTVLMMSAGVCIAAGLTLSYWADFAFAWLDPGSESWRVPIALQLVLIVIAAWLVLYMPESPRWLILAGREAEALHVLSALNDKKEGDRVIQQEFLQIKDAVIEMAQASFVNVFKMGDYRDGHRVILAVALQFFQQIGGMIVK